MKNLIKRFIAIVLILTFILSASMISSFAATAEETAYKAALTKAGFPTLYLDKLWQIHQKHPNWTFVAVNTGLDWDTAVAAESKLGTNVVWLSNTSIDKSATRLYRSQSEGDYTSSGIWDFSYYGRDYGTGGKWISCTPMCVAFYMNPYSFIGNDVTILQFESLEWPENFTLAEAEAAVEAALTGTFMSKTRNSYNVNYVTDEGYIQYKNADGTTTVTDQTYAHVIAQAAYDANLNPSYLASKICGESGSGTSGCVTGTHSTYPGYYNYLNIGASDSSEGKAVTNGLKYAQSQGWDTPMKAISDGAKFVAEKYVARGQNTMYFQKFNVTSYNTYGHQYCTAVNGVVNITLRSYKSYVAADTLDSKKTFYIPVFNNMPDATATSVTFDGFSTSGVTTDSVKLRESPGVDYTKIAQVEKGASLTVYGGYREPKVSDLTTSTSAVTYRMYCPLWVLVSTGGNKGYIKEDYVTTQKSISLSVGSTYKLTCTLSSKSTETPRYMTLDTRVATISSSGVVTAVKAGTTKAVVYTANGCFDVVTVVVSATNTNGVPTTATSSTYSVNNSASYISKVPAGTTASTLLAGLNERAYMTITKNDTALGDSDVVSTGSVVSIKDGSTVVKSYTVIVTGDVGENNGRGDGSIDVADIVEIRKQIIAELNNSSYLTGYNLKAADTNGDGSVDIEDLLLVRDHILGKSKITPRAY